MRQSSKRVPDSVEKTVRDIRRATCWDCSRQPGTDLAGLENWGWGFESLLRPVFCQSLRA
jgi:hypothetical protein